MASLERSRAWWSRAEAVIPLGTQTLSKGPSQFVQGVTPIYLERAKGAHVWDVDGNEYVDWAMALGPVILGYAERVVDDAVIAQLRDGITFTLMHPLEVEVAERIVAMCPGVEAVRFGKTGSDALSAAVRAARAHTGGDVVLAAGYHGWHDWYIGSTTRAVGVPDAVRELTRPVPFGDLDALEAELRRHDGRVAALVLEPVGAAVPPPDYLAAAIELTHRYGALTIFDEVITGFRLAPGGAQERYGVNADLVCYGKALGNGMPISAVAGRWEIMRVFEEIFFSGTHGGEALSLAAARAVLDTLADGTVLKRIRTTGEALQDGIGRSIERHGVGHKVGLGGEPERLVLVHEGDDLVRKSFVQQTLIERGILFNGNFIPSARHRDEDVDRTVAALDEAFATIAAHDDVAPLLKGPPIAVVFRKP